MYNRVALMLLINLIMTSTISSKPQRFYQRRWSTNREANTHTNVDGTLLYQRPLWKRNTDMNTDYQSDEQYNRGRGILHSQQRSDNGTFKILNRGSTSREQSDIVFPGPKSEYNPAVSIVPRLGEESPCGTSNTFCEKVDIYPTEYIDMILKNSVVNFAEYFPKDDNSIEVGQRFNSPGEEELCAAHTDIFRPRSAENKEGKWLFVVNQDNYIQEIKMELCNGTEEKCKFTENFPFGYETVCKQKYVFRNLYALDDASRKIIKDSFKLPSCCTCVVRYSGEVNSRSAFGATSSSKKTSSSHGRKARKAKRFVLN